MAFTPGDNYVGFTAEDFDVVKGFEGFNEWAGYFTSVADGDFFIFTGDSMLFLEYLADFEDEYPDIEFTQFAFLNSTWSIIGF